MRIHFKLLVCLLFVSLLNLSVYSQTKSLNLSKEDLKNWSVDQLEQLFMDVSTNINSGELKPIGINKDSAIKFITYFKFDNYDFIEIGSQVLDSTHTDTKFLFNNNVPPLIQKRGSRIELKSKYYKSSVSFKEGDWKRFIASNNTRNVFWHYYFKNACLSEDSLENISEKLFLNLSFLLIMDINKGHEIYKDPNLKNPVDTSIDLPLKTEIIQFIETDIDDPTNGYDTIYYMDVIKSITERHHPVELNVILKIENLRINITSIGIKYTSAYLKYDATYPYNEMEKKLLRLLIDYKLIN